MDKHVTKSRASPPVSRLSPPVRGRYSTAAHVSRSLDGGSRRKKKQVLRPSKYHQRHANRKRVTAHRRKANGSFCSFRTKHSQPPRTDKKQAIWYNLLMTSSSSPVRSSFLSARPPPSLCRTPRAAGGPLSARALSAKGKRDSSRCYATW